MLIFGGQNTTQMTKLGSRDSMPVSKQSGSLIDKNITVPAGQWWTTIPKSSLPSHFLQWNLIWWGKKIWHINTSCFQWLKSINMTDTNIFHLNVSQFRWYQREWDWKQTENNGEWDTTTFKITLYIAALSASTFSVSRIILLFDPSKSFADANNCRWIFLNQWLDQSRIANRNWATIYWSQGLRHSYETLYMWYPILFRREI